MYNLLKMLLEADNTSAEYQKHLAAVKQDGRAIWYVPKELMDKEIWLAAVTQTGEALGQVPNKLRTKEMCLAAVKQNGWALRWVPEKLRTKEMCILAAYHLFGLTNGGVDAFVKLVPKQYRKSRLLNTAIKQMRELYPPDDDDFRDND